MYYFITIPRGWPLQLEFCVHNSSSIFLTLKTGLKDVPFQICTFVHSSRRSTILAVHHACDHTNGNVPDWPLPPRNVLQGCSNILTAITNIPKSLWMFFRCLFSTSPVSSCYPVGTTLDEVVLHLLSGPRNWFELFTELSGKSIDCFNVQQDCVPPPIEEYDAWGMSFFPLKRVLRKR